MAPGRWEAAANERYLPVIIIRRASERVRVRVCVEKSNVESQAL